jgi:hypothetical protein
MDGRGAATLDRHLVHDVRQKADDTGELQVVRVGIPDIVGWHRDGSPVWEIAGAGEGYHNMQLDPIIVDESPITLATTQKALWPYARTLLPANFFSRVGRSVHQKIFGKATTDGTAGNYVAGLGYGSADAPTALAAGATVAGSTSQTNVSWIADAYFTSRTQGATGTLVGWGLFVAAVALMASTLQPYTLPSSALAAVTVDTTVGTNSPVLSLQRSGAGVWTATTQAIIFSALN